MITHLRLFLSHYWPWSTGNPFIVFLVVWLAIMITFLLFRMKVLK